MSNRAFKKVFGEDDVLAKVKPDSEDEAPTLMAGKKGFQLLNELSESETKDDDGVGEEGDNDETKGGEEDSSDMRRKRRKKKPRKKKDRKPQFEPAETEMEDNVETARFPSKPTTSSKAALLGGEKQCVNNMSKENAVVVKLFRIDPKFINNEFELKRIFGSRIVNAERSKTGQRRLFRGYSRIVLPKEQWALVAGSGISMAYLNTIDGAMYFKFHHNSHYQDVQRKFLQAVESLNPDNIVNLLRLHPYHIDAHTQLSDMAKAAEDMAVAADLVEGAIHVLENAFHVRFVLTNPLCRLDYKFQENRPFFILLFKHLVFVGLRACHRTALELCKKLLSLDMSDPLATLLMIDFYAIKAGEYEWFCEFYNLWQKPKNLEQLPNFAYSIALTYHLMSVKADGKEKEELCRKADWLIQYAILMFPSVLLPLLDKVGVQIDSRAKLHSYLNSFAQSSQSRSLRLLCELYVWRCHHVWRESSVLGWLETNVTIVLDRVDAKDQLVRDYEEKRKRRYQATTPSSILRHVILTDNKDLTFNFPPELAKETLLSFDPLPPPDSVDIYNIKELQNRHPQGAASRGILNMLIDSLWNDLNAPQPPREAEQQQRRREEGRENAPIALGGGLQQSVTALLDAMRDLLTNANGRPEGDAADGEDTGSEQED